MNAVELNEFKKIIQECEELRFKNADLHFQIRDLKADLARIEISNLNKKEGENN